VILPGMNYSNRVSIFIRDTNWDDLPDEVRRRALICLLDNLGVTLVGILAPISGIAARYASENWSSGSSTVLFNGHKVSAPAAAFANDCAANALVDRLVEMVWNFDQLNDVCELTILLANRDKGTGKLTLL
jgi:hypothetical protein